MTPAETSTKAKSVPMLVSSTTSLMLVTLANSATTMPVRIVVTCGVRYFGWIFAAHCGSRPSRAMEKKMRGCPSWNTISTEVHAKMAPSEMTPAAQFIPIAEKAVASGCAVPSCSQCRSPVSTMATAM